MHKGNGAHKNLFLLYFVKSDTQDFFFLVPYIITHIPALFTN